MDRSPSVVVPQFYLLSLLWLTEILVITKEEFCNRSNSGEMLFNHQLGGEGPALPSLPCLALWENFLVSVAWDHCSKKWLEHSWTLSFSGSNWEKIHQTLLRTEDWLAVFLLHSMGVLLCATDISHIVWRRNSLICKVLKRTGREDRVAGTASLNRAK